MTPRPAPDTISGVPLTEAILALRLTLLVALAVALPVIALASGSWGAGRARAELLAESQATLRLFQATLASEVEKNEAVPFLLARDREVAALLATPVPDAAAAGRLGRRLEEAAQAVHAAAIYVMNRDGITVASSNWNSAASFVGQNFGYRPYFRAALTDGVGRYFALGATSHQPGYYIAHPVPGDSHRSAGDGDTDHRAAGAVVIKVGMDRVEAGWAADPQRVAVTDSDGVIVITNTEPWRYRSLKPLSAADLARIEASQKYAGVRITPLPVGEQPLDGAGQFEAAPVDHGETIDIAGDGGGRVRFLMLSGPIPGTDWTLHVLSETGAIQTRAMTAAVIGALGTVIAILAGLQLLHRWMRAEERRADQQRAQADLEQRVEARTADLARAYARLSTEMRDRERAEQILGTAQSELVQAAKLAALGQMSAGVAHEINQPLSAIRAYADNAVTLLDRGRTGTVRDNLLLIAELTQRMAGITQQLKGFARQAAGTLGPVPLAGTIDKALALVGPQLRAERIEVVRDAVDPALPPVRAEDVRLQQVLVNLFANAIDAMKGRPRRQLTIGLEFDAGRDQMVLTVRDTGPGIPEADLPRLFVPFFTTKDAANGLGLGLSISFGIVQDFGGTIAAANHPDGGAMFTVRLMPMEPSQS